MIVVTAIAASKVRKLRTELDSSSQTWLNDPGSHLFVLWKDAEVNYYEASLAKERGKPVAALRRACEGRYILRHAS